MLLYIKMWKKFFFIILVILAIMGMRDNVFAQEHLDGKLVVDVKIANNNLISNPTILSKVKTQIGSVFSQESLNEDIKNLYATGYFTDINADLKEQDGGIVVTFIVTEKPLLKEIIFRGNKQIKDQRIRRLMNSQVDQPLDYVQLKQDIDKIKEFYNKEGYHLALVEEEILIDKDTSEARVFILIDEGGRYRISDIKVRGNESIRSKTILKSIQTKRDGLFNSGFFDKETFNSDLRTIKQLYADKGYADAEVKYNIDYNKNKNLMKITLDIYEGSKYTVGSISIKGNKVIDTQTIEDSLQMKSGSTYIPYRLEDDVARINEIYFEKGYISARTIPEVVFNKQKQQMDINYSITENNLTYVDKIIIRGNDKTKDIVIRRELKIKPGGVFDGAKLKRSKQNLNNLGYFEEITYDTATGSEPDKKDLIINVTEAKTGHVSFGAGYSSVDKFIGFVELQQRNFDWRNFPNFTGDGQKLSIRAEFGSEKEYYDLSFTEPWLFNKPISFGFDFYNRYRSRSLYEKNTLGGDVRLGRRIGDNLRISGMYKLERVKIGDIPYWATPDYLPEVWEEEGENMISAVQLNLVRDTRDSVYNPRSGGVIDNTVEVAGGVFGGDRDFIKYTGELDWYFTHFENFTFETRLRAGLAEKYDDTVYVPIYEKFYAGGANTIRGYKERHVGPKRGGEPVGGDSMLIGNLEYTFPVIKNIKGAVFYDIGNVWSDIGDLGKDYKSSVGLGVRVKTPIGPVKVDYGYGLDYDPGDKKGRFHFSMSRGF
jgi:outer membrane protein insertion porin family